jgi:6-phosphogluconolactonase
MGVIRKIIVFDEAKSLAEFAAKLWCEVYIESSSRSGLMSAAISGGHTPADFYKALAGRKESIQWEKVHIFLVDERFVLPTDEDSNYRMIRETLVGNVPIPDENVHPVSIAGLNPNEAAAEYEKSLKRHFDSKPGELPRFDLMALGLGEDGHTASLFPGNPMSLETKQWAIAVKPEKAPHDRITLTLPVINAARCVVILVTGTQKAEVLKRIVEDKDPEFPAARVKPVGGSLFFLADREAAGLLSKGVYVKAER